MCIFKMLLSHNTCPFMNGDREGVDEEGVVGSQGERTGGEVGGKALVGM